jgi:hypothetical protein
MDIQELKTSICFHHQSYVLTPRVHRKSAKLIDRFGRIMATKNQSEHHYEDKRNARDAKGDIRLGKWGEVGAWKFFQNLGFPAVGLDFEIRKGNRKKWIPDLPYHNVDVEYPNVHVKTCRERTVSIARGEYTWTFQWSNNDGSGGRDLLFRDEGCREDLVSLMYSPFIGSAEGIVVATAPWYKLRTILRNPISSDLWGIKKCVYYRDLVALTTTGSSV